MDAFNNSETFDIYKLGFYERFLRASDDKTIDLLDSIPIYLIVFGLFTGLLSSKFNLYEGLFFPHCDEKQICQNDCRAYNGFKQFEEAAEVMTSIGLCLISIRFIFCGISWWPVQQLLNLLFIGYGQVKDMEGRPILKWTIIIFSGLIAAFLVGLFGFSIGGAIDNQNFIKNACDNDINDCWQYQFWSGWTFFLLFLISLGIIRSFGDKIDKAAEWKTIKFGCDDSITTGVVSLITFGGCLGLTYLLSMGYNDKPGCKEIKNDSRR